jgi:hypothetical protein
MTQLLHLPLSEIAYDQMQMLAQITNQLQLSTDMACGGTVGVIVSPLQISTKSLLVILSIIMQ